MHLAFPPPIEVRARLQRLMKQLLRAETVLAVLVLVSLGLLLGGPRLLVTRLQIDPADGFETAVRSDQTAGGESFGEPEPTAPFEWRCHLLEGAAYPFCGYEILIDPARTGGLDLSNYHSLRVRLSYEGPTRTLRLFLRHFDSAYSRPDDPLSTKFNQIEFAAHAGEIDLQVSMRDFHVANWWMTAYEIAPQLGHPEFDNVVSIELQTGTVAALGEHRFKVHSIELVGQRISTERLYFGLVVAWLGLIVGWIVYRLVLLKQELSHRHRREVELLQINALLDARSRQLEEVARTDPLTGALNRHGLEEVIRAALSDGRGDNAPLSLILFDIDHFKRINDLHGHAAGDRVLSQMTRLVHANVRNSDRLARWGGEEFVLLCSHCDERQALGLAEKLRQLISDHCFEPALAVTASFGVATLRPGESLDQLFAAADAALYRAKRAGRDRVESEQP